MIDNVVEKNLKFTAPHVARFLEVVAHPDLENPDCQLRMNPVEARQIASLIKSLLRDRPQVDQAKADRNKAQHAWIEIRKANERLQGLMKSIKVVRHGSCWWLAIDTGRNGCQFPMNHPVAVEVMRAWDCDKQFAIEASQEARAI